MRSLKLPYAQALAPDLIATTRAQRWEPVEVRQHSSPRKPPAGPVHLMPKNP